MEEDHEELLQCSDDESLSETEEHCCPVKKPEEHYLPPLTFILHTKLIFFTTKVLLILSTFTLIIIMPLYIDTINVRGNVFSLILVNITFAVIIFVVIIITSKFLCNKYWDIHIFSFPIRFWRLLQISFVYMLCGFIVFYASDRKKVLCHLQDPIKGIVLVFALLYYFFFCRNLMGLHRIFSTTTVIVGLFIAVDYGLCDEFVCRGYERENISDDAGLWSWKIHSIWTCLYIFGLTLFAAYFTLLDRYFLPENNEMVNHNLMVSTWFLSTISRSVTAATSTSFPPSQENQINQRQQTIRPRKKSVLHLAMWIHIFCLGIVVAMFWIDFIPGVGKGTTVTESLNYTLNGVLCHFAQHNSSKHENENCGNVFWFMLIFLTAYVVFVATSITFLMLSQSAVYTIATMSFTLPLVGIWWSLFYATPNGELIWSPRIRGEFVCSVIGLPIVSVGLGLLCKAHFTDYHWFKQMHILTRNQPA